MSLVTVIFMPEGVVSTWSSTNYQGGKAEASASTAVTTQQAATATTAKRATTETCPSPSHTGRPAKHAIAIPWVQLAKPVTKPQDNVPVKTA